MGVAACFRFAPKNGDALWIDRARSAVSSLSPEPSLREAYDSQRPEGTIDYATRSYLHAVDLLASMSTASNFAIVYRQVLWSLHGAVCHAWDPEMSKTEYFQTLDRIHATVLRQTFTA